MDERWTVTRGREGGEVKRNGETVAVIRLTSGGMFAWTLLGEPSASGTCALKAKAAEEAREAWRRR